MLTKFKFDSALPFIGNSANALSSFIFSIFFLIFFNDSDYAVFSFSLVFIAFFNTFVNSVFIYPFISSLSIRLRYDCKHIGQLFICCLPFLLAVTYISFSFFDLGKEQALIISLFVVISILKNYIRVVFLQYGEFSKVYLNDIIFLFASSILACSVYYYKSVYYMYVALMASNLLCLFLMVKNLSLSFSLSRSLKYFLGNFKKYGANSLGSALGAEIMITAVSFVIIYGYGPEEYAPIAILFLFLRPFTIIQTALNQKYKYRISIAVNKESVIVECKKKYVRPLDASLLISFIFFFVFGVFFSSVNYFSTDLSLVLALVAIIMFLRVRRAWFTVIFQAGNDFFSLKKSYLSSGFLCLIAMVLVCSIGMPMYSVFAVLAVFEAVILIKLCSQRG